MDINETKKERLAELLTMNRVKYRSIGTNTHTTPDLQTAVAFEFDVYNQDKTPTVVTVSIDEDNNLMAFYDNAALDSRKFTKLLPQLKRFATNNDLEWQPSNDDRLDLYLQKRRKQQMDKHSDKMPQLSEAYYPISSQRSAGDHVPSVKIVIEHNRRMNEGEQRFRSINRIFVENTLGERILTPVKETSLARVFARVIAEGDLPHGQRWQHLETLCEEFHKIRGFVRATKNQVTEHALVGLGRSHYSTLKETLSRLAGHRGYNQYFESWQPTLIETEITPDISRLLESGEDPRIVEALPILHRLQRGQNRDKISESRELSALKAWANNLVHDSLFEDQTTKDPEESQLDEINRRGFLRTGAAAAAGAGLAGLGIHVAQDEARISREEALGKFRTQTDPQKRLAAAAELAGVSMSLIQKSQQLQDLVMLHAYEMSKPQPNPSVINKIKARIKTQVDRVGMDRGEVLDTSGQPVKVREGKKLPTRIPDDVLGATTPTRNISPVLGKREKPHPHAGKFVGASESVHPAPALNVAESAEIDDIVRLAKIINSNE